jgi:hypothetical protein
MKIKILGFIAFIALTTFVCCSSTTSSTGSAYNKVDEKVSTTVDPSDSWREEYKSWYRITKDEPNTGDPTGFVEKRHRGAKGYREIYINKIGETVNTGSAPYKYPVGTIVVKEAYKNKAAWEARKSPQVTTMIKLKAGESPETGDWGYFMGIKGKLSTGTSKWAKFCNKCHIYAVAKDYVFMNSDFIASLKK